MTTDAEGHDWRRTVACGAVALVAVGFLVWWWSPPPQIGTDEAVNKTVDALFTAVTTKDLQRLDSCEQRLKGYQSEGRLPTGPARILDGIIQQARAGKWDPAARRLYDFISGQRGG